MKDIIAFRDRTLLVLDQRKLPEAEEYLEIKNSSEAAGAIRDMAVRGAPAIGIAGAYGYCLGSLEKEFRSMDDLKRHMKDVKQRLLATRPTAVNLKWALDKMEKELDSAADVESARKKLIETADSIKDSEIDANMKIGECGAKLLKDLSAVKEKLSVLTHCNAGALATGGWGTALGVIKQAFGQGIIERVYVDETRPRLQGARLTCYELKKENIPHTLICDNMSGFLMARNRIDAVIVGADRIAANGDVANKIGTYTVAVLSDRHHVPFFVAAPESTFDLDTPSGDDIEIEERPEEEVLNIFCSPIAPEDTDAINPAFDITPHALVTAYITEKGALRKPHELQ
jgi:methylthioribose-1-phosphate isomerase